MEDLFMSIELIAFSEMVFPSPWPGFPRPAVQFSPTQAFYQPGVVPAKARGRVLSTGIQAFFKDILDSRVRGNVGLQQPHLCI